MNNDNKYNIHENFNKTIIKPSKLSSVINNMTNNKSTKSGNNSNNNNTNNSGNNSNNNNNNENITINNSTNDNNTTMTTTNNTENRQPSGESQHSNPQAVIQNESEQIKKENAELKLQIKMLMEQLKKIEKKDNFAKRKKARRQSKEVRNLNFNIPTKNSYEELEIMDDDMETSNHESSDNEIGSIVPANRRINIDNNINNLPIPVVGNASYSNETDLVDKIRNKNKNNVNINNSGNQRVTEKEAQKNNNAKKSLVNENGKAVEQKEPKLPPIIVYVQSPKDTVNLCKAGKITDFSVKKINANKHIIMAKKKEDYEKIKRALKEVEAQFFSYTPKSEKPKTFLLKGLTNEENSNELLKELKELEEENNNQIEFVKVDKFETKRSKDNGYSLPIYLIQMTANSQTNKLHSIKYVNYQKVKWEKLNNNVISQCKNCQRFGHAASNCEMQYRCVKCNNDHVPGKCTITIKSNEENTIITKAFCINCKMEGHPASYRGCPIYKKLLKNIQEKKEEKKNNNKSTNYFNSSYIQKSVNFADALKKGGNNNKNNQQQQQPQQQQQQQNRYEKSANAGKTNEDIDKTLQMIMNYMKENDKKMETLSNTVYSIMNNE